MRLVCALCKPGSGSVMVLWYFTRKSGNNDTDTIFCTLNAAVGQREGEDRHRQKFL